MNYKVCGCFNVKVEDLIKAKENGNKSLEAIVKETKIGTACGRCREKAEITAIKVLQNRINLK